MESVCIIVNWKKKNSKFELYDIKLNSIPRKLITSV